MKNKIYSVTIKGEGYNEITFKVPGDRLFTLLDEFLRTNNAKQYEYHIREEFEMGEINIPEEFADVLDGMD